MMKMRSSSGLAFACVVALGAGTARADIVTVFNEAGGATGGVVQGQMLVDPVTGQLALTFLLPEIVYTGDVGIYEGAIGVGPATDALRFTNARGDLNLTPNGDRMIFYSDVEGTDNDAADKGIPPLFNPTGYAGNPWGATEVGPEGSNLFVYVAGSNIYVGISDGSPSNPNLPSRNFLIIPGATVPEPSPLATTAAAGLLFLGYAGVARSRRSSRGPVSPVVV